MKKPLSSLTLKELRALAAEMGISPIAPRKAAIIQQINRALADTASLGARTVLELRAYARAAGISISSTLKAGIIAEIVKAIAPAPKVAASRPATKPKAKAKPPLMKRARPQGSVELAASKRWQSMGAAHTEERHPVVGATPPSAPEAEAPPATLTSSHRATAESMATMSDVAGTGTSKPQDMPELADDLPAGSIMALAVEPERLFAAWEVADHRLLRGDLVIRLMDMQPDPVCQSSTPVHLSFGGIFLPASPARTYMLELGEETVDGEYRPLKRSNLFSTPADGPSSGEAGSLLPEEHFRGRGAPEGSPGG